MYLLCNNILNMCVLENYENCLEFAQGSFVNPYFVGLFELATDTSNT